MNASAEILNTAIELDTEGRYDGTPIANAVRRLAEIADDPDMIHVGICEGTTLAPTNEAGWARASDGASYRTIEISATQDNGDTVAIVVTQYRTPNPARKGPRFLCSFTQHGTTNGVPSYEYLTRGFKRIEPSRLAGALRSFIANCTAEHKRLSASENEADRRAATRWREHAMRAHRELYGE